MYSRFSAAVRFSEPPLGTQFRALGGQPCAPTPQSWLRIPGVDRQPGRLRPRRRLHTSEPRLESADARYHAAWKARTARAQQPAMPVIGFLYFGWPDKNLVATFHKVLNEPRDFEGRHPAIQFRAAQNDTARLPELAADLVRRHVAAIAAPSGTAALAARAATKTIPIVFNTAGEIVGSPIYAVDVHVSLDE